MFFKVKGVCDNFFDMTYWNGVRKKIEAHLKQYNFSEIETPMLEYVSLFERGLGYETDVVSKQMFIIQPKKDGKDDHICLRPEGTAGTMRAYLEQQAKVVTPFKVFSYGSMFRYERPQKGRLRQFHQMNLEVIGAQSIMYDASFIKMLYVLFLEVFELESFVLKVDYLGQLQDRAAYTKALAEFLKAKSDLLCQTCQTRLETNVLRILDCKSSDCQNVIKDAPSLFEFLSQESKDEWQQLQDTLHDLSVTFVHDPQLVRGLDYYNKTVFEFTSDALGAQSAFCGGGRYDGLAQQLGSKTEVPALGCAIGMERLLLMLESKRATFAEEKSALICIIPFGKEQQLLALLLADTLQANGRTVDVLLEDQKIKNKMKKAHNLGASIVLLLGEDEQNNNTVTVKNMVTGEEQVVPQSDLDKVL